jgi:5-methylcytosine-specific restriction protein B
MPNGGLKNINMDQINREHILAAIQEIDREGIRPGRNSSTYDVIHEGKPYPPKLVISIANRFATGEELDSSIFSGGMDTPAFQLLKKEGFEIVSKRNDIQDLIRKYKKHILQTQLKDEKYKWELLHEFKGRPNIDAPDLLEEFKSIKYTNLIYAMGIAVLYHLLNAKPEEMRSLFRKLFDESNDLTQRIKSFNIESLALYRSLGETLQHHQDERTIASYLTFYNPEKYTFYKYSFYKKLCGLLNEKEAKKNEKYPHYLQLIHRLIEEYIQHDIELIELVKSYIPEYYDGSNNLLLTQDILYQMLDKNDDLQEINAKEEFANWFIANDGKISNYYSKQFGSKKERLIEELDLYKQEYKENFNTELFIIDANDFINQINIIKRNIYDKTTEFSKFSEKRSNDRPRAILGKNNYLKFLQERFNPKKYSNDEENFTASVEENNAQVYMQSNKEPLNQILYGPPGTGKTYNSINKALELIGESIKGKTRKEIKTLFEEKVNEGKIVFTTFHQNMSYEDFIEGIKPITVDNKVIYKIENGIFKKLCKKASEKKTSKNFDASYSNFVEEVLTKGSIILETPTHKKKFKVIINSNETAVAIPETEKGTNMGVTKEMSRDYVVNGAIRDWKPYTTSIGEYIKTEYPVDIEDIDNSDKKFVIIIDEINRGNVSKIFGELITLIEESKRTGKPEAITATLPYSKEEFSVPENVYILGTMNTADRSVEALDTALRRRFDFVEMMPKYDLYERNDKNYLLNGMFAFDILETINKRIEVLLGRDHLIGHSFFILDENESIEIKVKSAFYKNIIPLLQEYFYGDYNKIGLVLGSGFVTKTKVENHKELFANSKDFNGNDYVSGDSHNYNIAEFIDNGSFNKALDILMNKTNDSDSDE